MLLLIDVGSALIVIIALDMVLLLSLALLLFLLLVLGLLYFCIYDVVVKSVVVNVVVVDYIAYAVDFGDPLSILLSNWNGTRTISIIRSSTSLVFFNVLLP
jgi:hypothetical protein